MVDDRLQVEIFSVQLTFDLAQRFRLEHLELVADRRDHARIPGPNLFDEIAVAAAVFALDHAAPFRAVIPEFAIPFVVKEDYIALLQFLFARFGVHQLVEQIGVGRQSLFELLRPLVEQIGAALLLGGLLLLVVAALVFLLILIALLLLLIGLGLGLLLVAALTEKFVDAEGGDQRVADRGVVAAQVIGDYTFELEDDFGVSAPRRFVDHSPAERDL